MASGTESSHPFQMQPVLGFSYSPESTWRMGANYDFSSLAFELSHRLSDDESSRSFGLAMGLVPELRSFSWRFGPWVNFHALYGTISASAALASVNAWGYGLWASDVSAARSGRTYLLPLQTSYSYVFSGGLIAQAGLATQWGLGSASVNNHFAISLGFAKEFQ